MNPSSEADSINQKLSEFYATILGPWKVLREDQKRNGHHLSIPFFLKASPAFLSAKPRIMFVGQETHGWYGEFKDDVNSLTAHRVMDVYGSAWSSLYLKYRRSVYWQALRQMAGGLGVNDPPGSFLYSNIFPCDLDQKRTSEDLHDIFRSWKMLPTELNLLKPDYVIFFCGREYYGNLQAFFGEWPKQFVSAATPLVEYRPSNQSWKGYVTYHPAYLRRSKQWRIIEEVISRISTDLGSAKRFTDPDVFEVGSAQDLANG